MTSYNEQFISDTTYYNNLIKSLLDLDVMKTDHPYMVLQSKSVDDLAKMFTEGIMYAIKHDLKIFVEDNKYHRNIIIMKTFGYEEHFDCILTRLFDAYIMQFHSLDMVYVFAIRDEDFKRLYSALISNLPKEIIAFLLLQGVNLNVFFKQEE